MSYSPAIPAVPVVSTKTASFSLGLADAGTIVQVTASAGVTVTVPAAATVAFAAQTIIEVTQLGSGQVTLAGAAGVQLLSPATLKLRAQYSTVALRLIGADTWLIVGDVATA